MSKVTCPYSKGSSIVIVDSRGQKHLASVTSYMSFDSYFILYFRYAHEAKHDQRHTVEVNLDGTVRSNGWRASHSSISQIERVDEKTLDKLKTGLRAGHSIPVLKKGDVVLLHDEHSRRKNKTPDLQAEVTSRQSLEDDQQMVYLRISGDTSKNRIFCSFSNINGNIKSVRKTTEYENLPYTTLKFIGSPMKAYYMEQEIDEVDI